MLNHSKKLSDKQMAGLLALLVAIMPFSVDTYLPAMKDMATQLHADIHLIERSLSSFILGVAAGQLVGGSLSDIKGRKNMALMGLAVYMLGSMVLIFVQNSQQLIGWRLVQAVGAGMSTVTVGSIIRDNYDGKQAAQMFALIGIIMMGAPLVAPMTGAVLQQVAGWRSIFAFLLLYGLVAAVLLWRFLPKNKTAEPFTRHLGRDIWVRYRRILKTKQALGFLFFQAASFSSMIVFLTESPFVYMQLYGLSPQQYAWAFAANIVSMAAFNRFTAWRLKHNGASQQLLLAGIVIQALANTMLAFGVAWWGVPSFEWLMTGVMVSVGTQGLIMANTQALYMHYFREDAGSANALLLTNQSLTAALVGFLATVLHNGSAQVLAYLMPMCTVVGAGLLFLFSREIWRR